MLKTIFFGGGGGGGRSFVTFIVFCLNLFLILFRFAPFSFPFFI